ncbi:MAG: hypothetical protein ACKV2T_35215 [Kofleriaceae bacterium]
MRRPYAALLCFVWLLAVEVLPNVHLHSHGDHAHEHAADGTVITVSFESSTHRHDGVTHSHADAHEPARDTKKKARDILAIDHVPDLHAAAGLAHRALALHEPPPPVLDAIATVRVTSDIIDVATGRETVAFEATADARGPPIRS